MFENFPKLQRFIERLSYIKKAIVAGTTGAAGTGATQPIDFGLPPFWNIALNALVGAAVFGLAAYGPANGPKPT